MSSVTSNQATVSFRMVNVDFDGFSEYQMADDILLKKLSSDILHEKYPSRTIIAGLGKIETEWWENHSIEAVITLNLSRDEQSEYFTVRRTNELENLITEPFWYSGILLNSFTYATHCQVSFRENQRLHVLGYNGYSSMPTKFSLEDLKLVSKAHKIIKEIKLDSVLSRAFNRFLIANKEDLHSPNLVNTPNIDKLLDYIISLETLLLSTREEKKNELAYRFKINGTSVLKDLIDIDKTTLLKVLGIVYDIRSKIVHGNDEVKIIKSIDSVFLILGISNSDNSSSIGKIETLSRLLNDWIKNLFEVMTKLPLKERPYNKTGGWEELLWN